ncbi:MAG: FAD-dependent oxidoreductase [Ignavibacterium sp.]
MKNYKSKSAIIIGSGLGGLSTALRLSYLGYDVTVIEKHSKPGGRLNQLKIDGFTFDVGHFLIRRKTILILIQSHRTFLSGG